MAKKKTKDWTESDIATAVVKRFPAPSWAFLTQVRRGPGFHHNNTADAIAMHTWPSRGLYLVGFEFKVTRGDWRRELTHPGKSEEIQCFCRNWYMVTPKGQDIIQAGELPKAWGHLECTRAGTHVTKEAPDLKFKDPDLFLLASIMRNATRSMVPSDDVDELVKDGIEGGLEQQRKSDTRSLERLREAVDKFEKASGVKITDEWTAGRMGEAVKVLVSEHSTGLADTLEHIRDQHRRGAEGMDKVLTELKERTTCQDTPTKTIKLSDRLSRRKSSART